MKEKSYFSDIVCSLEKALYYERGRGAYFRATMVGTDFIERKRIEGNRAEEIIDNCIKVLVDSEMIRNATYLKDESGTFFNFEIKGCTHLPVEARLREEGVPAYICPPINMVLYKIGQLVNLAVEIADISVKESEGRCVVKVVVFEKEKPENIGSPKTKER